MQYILAILWPSFLVAGVGEGVFFTLIDPRERSMCSLQPDNLLPVAYRD